jgi:predicted PurR-regulated permease PerM
MASVAQKPSIVRVLVAGASIVIIVAGMKAAASILSPILLATILAISIAPLPNWLHRKGLPKWLAQLLAVLLVFVLIVGVGGLVAVSVFQLQQTLPQYAQNLDQQKASLEGLLGNLGIDPSGISSFSGFEPTKLLGFAGSFLGSLAGVLSGVAMMLLVLMMMIIGTTGFGTTLKIGFPAESPSLGRFRRLATQLRQYFSITTRINLVIGTVDAVFLFVLGVDFPILWGLIAFLLGYIPSVGFWLALVPPALLALFELGTTQALIVVIGYVVINGGIQNFVQPRWMGAGLDISPIAVTISLFFWAWVLGPLGALLAVPMTMIVKQGLLEGFDETRGIAVLLGAGGDESDEGT